MQALVEVLDSQLDNSQQGQDLAQWMPPLLRASHVVSLEVRRGEQKIYAFRDLTADTFDNPLINYRYPMPTHPGMQAHLQLERPFKEFSTPAGAVRRLGWRLYRGVWPVVLHSLAPAATARR